MTAKIPVSSFRYTQGQATEHKTKNGVKREFCGICGSYILEYGVCLRFSVYDGQCKPVANLNVDLSTCSYVNRKRPQMTSDTLLSDPLMNLPFFHLKVSSSARTDWTGCPRYPVSSVTPFTQGLYNNSTLDFSRYFPKARNKTVGRLTVDGRIGAAL